MKRVIYSFYKKMQNKTFVATIASVIYTKSQSLLRQNKIIPEISANDSKTPIIAFVCDEMTWQDFKDECRAVFVTPQNWRSTFEKYRPGLFFCESAWSGIEESKNSWRGRIYKNKNVYYENRRELLEILDYCKRNQVITVFWNKEDPTFFGNETYNFVDTALHFDLILTTATECIAKYQELGHKNIYLWRFGFSARLFYPPEDGSVRDNKAVFAGSWYNDQQQRCIDTAALFDMVLSNNIELVIYDRNANSSNPINQFPKRYSSYLRPSVPFHELGDIYRRSAYVLNINTSKESNTMFARRVFEAMACGCIVISNLSKGLLNQFPGRIWFEGSEFEQTQIEKIRIQNIQEVFLEHTCSYRIKELFTMVEKYDKEK